MTQRDVNGQARDSKNRDGSLSLQVPLEEGNFELIGYDQTMRILEGTLLFLLASAAVCLLAGRKQRIYRLLMATALLVLVAHSVLEGAHWQMIPAYIATGILCLAVWKPIGIENRFQKFIAWPALALASVSVLLSFVLPMFSLPEVTGPYPVGTSILYLKDSGRIEDAAPVGGSPRELMVQLWYPAQPSHNRFANYREPRETDALSSYQSEILTHSRLDAPVALAGAPFPVILLNHAWGGRRTNDTFLTEELASHGYVVASIDHTYNARLVAFPDGRIVHGTGANEINVPDISTPERVRAIWDKELIKWVADQHFVLDRMEDMNSNTGSRWLGRFNINMTGAIGHSFGGSAATAECAQDPRVHASVNMDGWFFDAIRERVPNQPLLVIDATTDQGDGAPGPNATAEAILDATDSADMKSSLSRFGGYLLSVKGAEHEDFTDQPLVSPLRILSHRGTIPAQQIQTIVRSYVLAFFDNTLRGAGPGILAARTGPYVEASLKVWPTSNKVIVSPISSDGP
jgi:dienelactone hydrolase